MRTKVATMAWAAFGTRVSRFRMKWVRHRCQRRSRQHRSDGVLQTLVGVGDDEADPESPRATRPRRKAVHPAPSSVVKTSSPRTSRCPSTFTPVAITMATFTPGRPLATFWTKASSQT